MVTDVMRRIIRTATTQPTLGGIQFIRAGVTQVIAIGVTRLTRLGITQHTIAAGDIQHTMAIIGGQNVVYRL